MAGKQLIANRPEALPKRRRTENLPDDLYYFEDELAIENILKANVMTCGRWLLEIFKLKTGEVSFFVDKEEIRPSFAQMAVLYPPFSITRLCFKNAGMQVKGIAGMTKLPPRFSTRPSVFEADFANFPKSAAAVVEILESSRDVQFVEAHPKASLLSLKAKRLIDENYRIFPSIARIAARLDVSHAHLTRQFKRDFGLSPNAYLHQIRIADATFRLTRGEPIIDVSGDVGYNDLSRFYKQFRKSNVASPGFCQTKK